MAEDRGKTQMHVKDTETPGELRRNLRQWKLKTGAVSSVGQYYYSEVSLSELVMIQSSLSFILGLICSHCGFIVRLVHSTKQVYYH